MWMNDKAGTAANHDYGRDEDAAVKALKKHKVCTKMARGTKTYLLRQHLDKTEDMATLTVPA